MADTTFSWKVASMVRTLADGVVHTVHYTVANKFGDEKVQEIQAALQAQIDQQRTLTTGSGVPW